MTDRETSSEGAMLLDVRDLDVAYLTEAGQVPACSKINLQIRRGEIIGIAGESASGIVHAMEPTQEDP